MMPNCHGGGGKLARPSQAFPIVADLNYLAEHHLRKVRDEIDLLLIVLLSQPCQVNSRT
jgi:hypothetical protein